jgi:hypothetical protein
MALRLVRSTLSAARLPFSALLRGMAAVPSAGPTSEVDVRSFYFAGVSSNLTK